MRDSEIEKQIINTAGVVEAGTLPAEDVVTAEQPVEDLLLLSEKDKEEQLQEVEGLLSKAESYEVAALGGSPVFTADVNAQSAGGAATGGGSAAATGSGFSIGGLSTGASLAVIGGGIVGTALVVDAVDDDDDDSETVVVNGGNGGGGSTNQTFDATVSNPSVTEGDAGTKTLTFTITLSEAPNGTVTLNVVTADGTATANSDYTPVSSTVTFAQGQTQATVSVDILGDTVVEGDETFTVTVSGAKLNAPASGTGTIINDDVTTFTLTTGADNFVGTAGDDVFLAQDASGAPTLTSLDNLNGAAGSDTLNIVYQGAEVSNTGATVANIETVNISTDGDVGPAATFDVSSWTGLLTANVNKTGANGTSTTGTVDLTAAATTDVNVTGGTTAVTGAVTLAGGQAVNVTGAQAAVSSTDAAGPVSIGSTSGAVSVSGAQDAVTVDHSALGADDIIVNGSAANTTAGTDVSVTASEVDAGAANGIVVGADNALAAADANDQPSGDVTVSSTGLTYDAATGNYTMSGIRVDGGSSVSVTQSASADDSAAAADTTADTVTQGAVTVNGGDTTTSVTVSQDAAVTAVNAVTAVAGSAETQQLVFGAMVDGDTAVVGGLTFTAARDLTAAEVAAAFAGLASGDTSGSAPDSDGQYTGAFDAAPTPIGYTSGGVVVDGTDQTVTFTSDAEDDVASLAIGGTLGVVTAGTQVDGVLTVDAVDGVMGVANGAVTVDDNATASIASVSLDGYGAATLGGTTALDALTSLSLANSAAAATVTTAATTLGLTVDNVMHGVSVDGGAPTVTTLDVTTANADSAFGLTAAVLTDLSVGGTNELDLSTGSTLTLLENVTVTGSAGLEIDLTGLANQASVDTSGTTGDSRVTMDGTLATFTGGAGEDEVILTTANPTQAISLGGGDDELELATGTTTAAAGLDGGAGNDLLVMDGDDAALASANTLFGGQISGFEGLGLIDTGATVTVNMANLDNISNVLFGGGNVGAITLSNLANAASLEFYQSHGAEVIANLTDASGASDSVNVLVEDDNEDTVSDDLTIAELRLTDIENVNLTVSNDGTVTDGTNSLHTVNLIDSTLATDLTTETIVVDGDADLTLESDSADLTSVDASALTGDLILTTNAARNAAATLTGGSGDDQLTANHDNDVLIGGAGDDNLISLADVDAFTMTGGAGNDTFTIGVQTSGNSYGSITDAASGDIIDFAAAIGIDGFDSTSLNGTLNQNTAVFQDFLDAAVNNSAADGVSWFQFGGNTYVVQDAGLDSLTTFQNGEDIVVELAGLIDLSTAINDNGNLVIA